MPLTLVPTPIGNLEDITLRALRVLRNADLIACEDTRTSSVLLRRYHIAAPLVPFHLHNEKECLPRLMEALRAGKSVAVVSDAGTPGVSDPGWILLRSALDEGLEADVLPGPSALLPALLLSGLTPHPFLRIVGFHWTRLRSHTPPSASRRTPDDGDRPSNEYRGACCKMDGMG